LFAPRAPCPGVRHSSAPTAFETGPFLSVSSAASSRRHRISRSSRGNHYCTRSRWYPPPPRIEVARNSCSQSISRASWWGHVMAPSDTLRTASLLKPASSPRSLPTTKTSPGTPRSSSAPSQFAKPTLVKRSPASSRTTRDHPSGSCRRTSSASASSARLGSAPRPPAAGRSARSTADQRLSTLDLYVSTCSANGVADGRPNQRTRTFKTVPRNPRCRGPVRRGPPWAHRPTSPRAHSRRVSPR